VLQLCCSRVAVSCSRVAVVLQCVAVCYSVLQRFVVRCSVLQCEDNVSYGHEAHTLHVLKTCSVLQLCSTCVEVCCSVLHCVAVSRSVRSMSLTDMRPILLLGFLKDKSRYQNLNLPPNIWGKENGGLYLLRKRGPYTCLRASQFPRQTAT